MSVGIGDFGIAVMEHHSIVVGGLVPVGEGPGESGMAVDQSDIQIVVTIICHAIFGLAKGGLHIPRHKGFVKNVVGMPFGVHIVDNDALIGRIKDEFFNNLEGRPIDAVNGGKRPNAKKVDATKIINTGIGVSGVCQTVDQVIISNGTAVILEKRFSANCCRRIANLNPAIVGHTAPGSLTIIRTHEDVDVGLNDGVLSITISCRMVSNII